MVEEISLQDQILNTAAEMHSAQDGIFLSIATALVLTGSEMLPIVAIVLGVGGVKAMNKMVFARKAVELVRVDDIRSNPEYFLVTYVVGTVFFSALLYYGSMFIPPL